MAEEQFLAAAVGAAKSAGEIIRKSFYLTKNVEHKGQVDLVTETDKACEDLIFNHLRMLYPDHKFIGEETSAALGSTDDLTYDPTWIVDPLDGTTNFVHGFPFVCVSIGLTIGKIPTVGVVYNPIMNELFTAVRGKGAFLNGSPIKTSPQNELVKALMVTEWDQDLVQQVFNADDVPHILSIPIKEGFDDLPAWHPDPKGNFSVRSAYKLKLQLDDVAAGQTSTSTEADPTRSTAKVWTKLWSLKMPWKIIMFLWKLSHDTLPVRLNLKRRGIDLDTVCPMYKRLDEDGGHAFLKCKFAKAVWREANQEHVRGLLLSCADAKQSVEVQLCLENVTSMFCICLMWNLWNARNAVNNGDRCPSAAAIVSCSAVQVTEFSEHLRIPSCSVVA